MTQGRTFSGIQLGQNAVLGGQTYRVIGRVAYKGHDDEESWIWEEWRLTDGKHDYWLEYEPEYPRFTLYRETMEMPHPISGKIIDPNETGTLTSFEGDIPWPAKVGEEYTYTTYKIGPNQLYSVETDQGENEFFVGTILPTSDVKKAFGLTELKLRGPNAATNQHMGIISSIFWTLVFFVVLVAPVIEELMDFETPVFTATFMSATGTRLGLIRLEKVNHPYIVEVDSNVRSGVKPDVTFLLRDASEEEIASKTVNAPAATTSAPRPVPLSRINDAGQSLFRVTKPGMYVLEIVSTRTQPSTTLEVTVSKNAYMAYLFWLPYGLYSNAKQLISPNAY